MIRPATRTVGPVGSLPGSVAGTGSADRRDGLVPIESLAPGVDSQGGDPLELFQANSFEALTRLVGHSFPLLLLDSSLRANRTPNCMDLTG